MASSDDIATLRRITNEPGTDHYSDLQMGEYIDDSGSIDAAAATIWQEKAARASNLVNVSESGSSRSNQQIYQNALDQAKFYSGRVEAAGGVIGIQPFVTPIERQ